MELIAAFISWLGLILLQQIHYHPIAAMELNLAAMEARNLINLPS